MKKLLALNRGEIAIRILRAATELGLRTVAVYSQEDRLSLHRFKADEAYLIGQGKGPVQAYLDVDGIVALAAEKGVDAIHPGYGFLSENPAFRALANRPESPLSDPVQSLLELLGDKTAARRLADEAGIPVDSGHGRSRSPMPKAATHREPHVSASRSSSRPPSAAAAEACALSRPRRDFDWPARRKHAQEAGAAFRQRGRFPRALSSAAPSILKFRSSATSMETSCTFTSATARCSGAIKRWSRSRPA